MPAAEAADKVLQGIRYEGDDRYDVTKAITRIRTQRAG